MKNYNEDKNLFIKEAMLAVLRSPPANAWAAKDTVKDTGELIARVAFESAKEAWRLYDNEINVGK